MQHNPNKQEGLFKKPRENDMPKKAEREPSGGVTTQEDLSFV